MLLRWWIISAFVLSGKVPNTRLLLNHYQNYIPAGVEVSMTCTVHSLTTDGLPLPEVTWQCPSKLLTEYVDDGEGDMVHATFIDGVTTGFLGRF